MEAEIGIGINGFVRSFVRRTANRTAFPHTIFSTGLVIGTDFVGTKCGCFWFGLVIGSDFVGTKCGCFGSAHPGISAQTPFVDEALQDEMSLLEHY